MRHARFALAAAATAAIAAAGSPAAAQIIGPGFGVSGYVVTTNATVSPLGAFEINSFQNGSASSLVQAGPFASAFAEAAGLTLHGNALACCAGAGEAGAGASGKILYHLTGGTPGTVYDLAFTFTTHTDFQATGLQDGDAILLADYGAIIGSDKGSVQINPGLQIQSLNGAGPTASGVHGFAITNFQSSADEDVLDATFVVHLQASSFVVLEDSLGLHDSTTAGGIHADQRVFLSSITLDQAVNGPLPTLTGDGVPPLGVSPVPEPATWMVMILGFTGIGACLRARPRKGAAAAA